MRNGWSCDSPATFDVTWRDMIWRDMTWYDVTWYDVTLRDVTWRTWYDVASRGMIDVACLDMTWGDVTRHGLTWHDATWRDMTWRHFFIVIFLFRLCIIVSPSSLYVAYVYNLFSDFYYFSTRGQRFRFYREAIMPKHYMNLESITSNNFLWSGLNSEIPRIGYAASAPYHWRSCANQCTPTTGRLSMPRAAISK